MIFDTHAHYDDEQFDEDREEMILSLPENGIEAAVDVGATVESSRFAAELAKKYPHIYAAAGVHPDYAGEMSEEKIFELERLAKENPKVVAVGEIGLDYYWDKAPREIQQYWFRRQLALARSLQLPVIIHSREAAKDTFDLLKSEKAEEIGGVIHCYSGSVPMAKDYVKMGFFLGIGGVLTFKNAKTIREVVSAVGIEPLVLETDCPYLAPVPNRGKRNSSRNLPFVAAELARILNLSEEEVIAVTCRNAKKLYRLEEKHG